ncbi:MAG: ACP S-malonyltransferase [Thermoguttaceae bacterium]|nr:ACP S-malonyltransferase [Thermoguttaceae bacterium]
MGQVAILFPGQGAQVVGMGRRLMASSSVASDLYKRASEILGYDLVEMCLEGPSERLNSTVVSQPAIFVTSLAAVEVLRQGNASAVDGASFAAGLSLGEYTALAFSGVLDFDSGVRLVQCRGKAMQAASDAVPSGMVSVLGLEQAKVSELIIACREGETLEIANLLCPKNIVVSGTKTACLRITKAAQDAGAMMVIPLTVAGAFHTKIMEPAVAKLTEIVDQTEFKPARIPVVSNVDAKPHTDPAEIRALLKRQIISPVLWEDSQRWLLAEGCDQFYEAGPGRVLQGLLKRIDRKAKCDGVEV